jgi:hypothetical protein
VSSDEFNLQQDALKEVMQNLAYFANDLQKESRLI